MTMPLNKPRDDSIGRVAERYLPFVTVLVTVALGAVLKLRSANDTELLWAIWAILSLLAVSEFFKRVQTLDRFSDQLDDLHEAVIPAIESLKGREEFYDQCTKLIEQSKEIVLDTTWGADPTPPTFRETRARTKYRQARKDAVERGIQYLEIYTVPSAERLKYLKAALKEVEEPRIRVLRGLQPNVPLIDFVVIDSHIVLFSRPDVDVIGGDTTVFARVKNTTLGSMFGQFFDECWNLSREVKLEGDVVVFKDTGECVLSETMQGARPLN
jgi:hypothetical protein